MNKFLCHYDDERRQARRTEKKRRLAEIEVMRLKLQEYQNIFDALESDSGKAADSHSEHAGRLQSELDRLDSEHVAAIMAGKVASEKSIQRRSEIMAELAKLNQILETTCEANRRAALPIKKQIDDLRIEIGKATSIKNELVALASVAIRRQRLFNDLKQRSSVALSNEIQRRLAIAERNCDVSKANENAEDLAIHSAQADDYRWMLTQVASEVASIKAAEDQLIQQALSE